MSTTATPVAASSRPGASASARTANLLIAYGAVRGGARDDYGDPGWYAHPRGTVAYLLDG